MLRGFEPGRPKAWPDANKVLNSTPYAGGRVPAGVKRYTFSPDAAYAKELKAVASPDEIPEPPCGAWGEMPDGIQYFEVPEGGGRKVLFVRIGQDEPSFDGQTLEVLQAG
ncbi:hypothetical protein ENZ76_15760 [Mesorhizobium sp. M7A.F.Ca.CA.002.10.1.1]|uniref:hypothetical protein n=1 Tax=Mesorhizobium TaxID=68287 RepID=UPI000FCC7837|nr:MULTISPECIES: hypothetical protein [Mesorhizobium]RUZ48703.1 hypothetical protein EN948_07405 [Mesorhizobium sp. M7A.F.Ca.US.003.02.1.1]RUZ65476.1 hypothetical protein EN950_12795 [Mesorhizobium sp. M7A.F.Ca.US.007.01.1.1]RUZ91699.1 hypothetical protein EN947_03105 [Mesorhizobium sp. M7A.F.Ca.US.003.02.2.1]RVC18704.1 hypothetical protein EN884_04120 [Mesorhizobium sp. M7A.F.Ca.AU.001.01.1.1]RVC22300.1 hypothetical protein EN879_19025 [Mesorhizobium sp. M7A.F.Ca.AU.002.02.1.1]TPI90919.1 hyp